MPRTKKKCSHCGKDPEGVTAWDLEMEEAKRMVDEFPDGFDMAIDTNIPKPIINKGWRCRKCQNAYDRDDICGDSAWAVSNIPSDFICPSCESPLKEFDEVEITDYGHGHREWPIKIARRIPEDDDERGEDDEF